MSRRSIRIVNHNILLTPTVPLKWCVQVNHSECCTVNIFNFPHMRFTWASLDSILCDTSFCVIWPPAGWLPGKEWPVWLLWTAPPLPISSIWSTISLQRPKRIWGETEEKGTWFKKKEASDISRRHWRKAPQPQPDWTLSTIWLMCFMLRGEPSTLY